MEADTEKNEWKIMAEAEKSHETDWDIRLREWEEKNAPTGLEDLQ